MGANRALTPRYVSVVGRAEGDNGDTNLLVRRRGEGAFHPAAQILRQIGVLGKEQYMRCVEGGISAGGVRFESTSESAGEIGRYGGEVVGRLSGR